MFSRSRMMMASKMAPGIPEDVRPVYCYEGAAISDANYDLDNKKLVVDWTNPPTMVPEVPSFRYDMEATWSFGEKTIHPDSVPVSMGNNRVRRLPTNLTPPSEGEEVMSVRIRGKSTSIGSFSPSADVLDGSGLSPTSINWQLSGSQLTVYWSPPNSLSFYEEQLGWVLDSYLLRTGIYIDILNASAFSHTIDIGGNSLGLLTGQKIYLAARYTSNLAGNSASSQISIRDRSPIKRILN